jgi:hypothetical protein
MNAITARQLTSVAPKMMSYAEESAEYRHCGTQIGDIAVGRSFILASLQP